ncbi:MAG TPA: CPBP family intramembrane glutamic endopeptidase [Caulifigura sp.]|jgi:membrane protease YdiL (CAAX protease family)|nr:CPBP family intramembrane glutamic endopeptidase [Caulifigura sp.]
MEPLPATEGESGDLEATSIPGPEGLAAAEPGAQQHCPRCRKSFDDQNARCPHCGAAGRRNESPPTSTGKVDAGWGPWNTLLVGYALSLLTLVIGSLIIAYSNRDGAVDELVRLKRLTALDIVFGIVVLSTFVGLRGEKAVEVTPARRWWIVWPLALVAMAGAVLLNHGYHETLFSMGVEEIDLVSADTEYWWLWMAAVCIQPAIFEELFFRGCCWRVFTPVLGIHSTVLISSVMFGMAHVGVPLSVPILTLVGFVLGYARAYSGSIWLPALLHFLHNLVVIQW